MQISIMYIYIKHTKKGLFRYMSEKKFEQHSWFLYYPEEENSRGAPTNLFRSFTLF